MKDGNAEAVEGLIELVEEPGAKIITAGIEAIREMQAELAAREEAEKPVQDDGVWTDATLAKYWQLLKDSETCIKPQYQMLRAPLAQIVFLKEELHTLKTSWEFQGGERIIAERDDLRRQRDSLCRQRGSLQDDVKRLKSTKDRAQTLLGEMRSERAAAMTERDTLRDKLRATEEAWGVAEGQVARLEERTGVLETEMDNARLYRGRTGEVWFAEVQRLLRVIESSRSALSQAARDAS